MSAEGANRRDCWGVSHLFHARSLPRGAALTLNRELNFLPVRGCATSLLVTSHGSLQDLAFWMRRNLEKFPPPRPSSPPPPEWLGTSSGRGGGGVGFLQWGWADPAAGGSGELGAPSGGDFRGSPCQLCACKDEKLLINFCVFICAVMGLILINGTLLLWNTAFMSIFYILFVK